MPAIHDLIDSNDSLGLKKYLESNKSKLELRASVLVGLKYDELTPLQFAAWKNNVEAMKIILEMGGNPFSHSDEKISTALHYAVHNMNYEAVVLLLDSLQDDEKKALIKMKDRAGKTALHYLIENAETNPEVAILIYNKLLGSIPQNYRSKFLNKQDKSGQSALYVLVLNATEKDKTTDCLIENFVGEMVDLKLDQLTVTQYSVMKLLPTSHLSNISKQRLIYAHSRQQTVNASSNAKVAKNSNQVSSSYAVVIQLSSEAGISKDVKEMAERIYNFKYGVCGWFDQYLAEKRKNQSNHNGVYRVHDTQQSTEINTPTRAPWKDEVQPKERPMSLRVSTPNESGRQPQQAAPRSLTAVPLRSRNENSINGIRTALVNERQFQQVASKSSTAVALPPLKDAVAIVTTSPSANVRA
jgi:hypothetical protein